MRRFAILAALALSLVASPVAAKTPTATLALDATQPVPAYAVVRLVVTDYQAIPGAMVYADCDGSGYYGTPTLYAISGGEVFLAVGDSTSCTAYVVRYPNLNRLRSNVLTLAVA